MTMARLLPLLLLALLAMVPFTPMGGMREYVLHVFIQIFIWAFLGGAWALMGRFGLVSLGHGAFLGIGAYTTTLLWNTYGLSPWIGGIAAVALTVVVALIIAYPCSRFQVIGHYFALVTLAVGEVVRLLLIAERDWTGGSLGLTLKPGGSDASLVALQFADKRVFYYATLVLWLLGLYVWVRIDRSMARAAMEAIGEDETAAASVGIHVTRFKLGISVLSAVLTAVGGIMYAQYMTYVNPDTLSGIGVSLRIVFAVVLGGMYSLLGPTVGTSLTIALSEYLRIFFGVKLIGMAETIYGLVLMLFIIFLPAGIYGSIRDLRRRRDANERRYQMRYETQTAMSPQEVLEAAIAFFGGELGLAVQGRTPDRLQFVGGGGHVSLSVGAGNPVVVELETREWDIQVEAFMERIARKRWGVF